MGGKLTGKIVIVNNGRCVSRLSTATTMVCKIGRKVDSSVADRTKNVAGYGTSALARCFRWPSGTYKGGERWQIIISTFVPRTGEAIFYMFTYIGLHGDGLITQF